LDEWARTVPNLRSVFDYLTGNVLEYPYGLGTILRLLEQLANDGGESVSLDKEVDFSVDGNTIYKGWAEPGVATSVASWRISRIIITPPEDDVNEIFANGTNEFVHVWDDRATLDYTK